MPAWLIQKRDARNWPNSTKICSILPVFRHPKLPLNITASSSLTAQTAHFVRRRDPRLKIFLCVFCDLVGPLEVFERFFATILSIEQAANPAAPAK
jgi:hypothetical protein